MRVKEIYYPYPVLTPYSDDIIGDKFIGDVRLHLLDSEIQFEVNMQLNNITLLKLIEEDKVLFAIQLSCQSTMQRFLFTTKNTKYIFSINSKLLSGTVYVNFYVIANNLINNYSNLNFHKDYEGEKFNIQKGEKLAIAQTIHLEIEKEAIINTSSIFQLVPNYEENGPLFSIDILDKIIIRIPIEVHHKIQTLYQYGSSVNTMLISLYYLPALVEVLYYIKELIINQSLEEEENREWFKSLNIRLNNLGVNINELDSEYNLTNLALRILEDPNCKSLDVIENQWEGD